MSIDPTKNASVANSESNANSSNDLVLNLKSNSVTNVFGQDFASLLDRELDDKNSKNDEKSNDSKGDDKNRESSKAKENDGKTGVLTKTEKEIIETESDDKSIGNFSVKTLTNSDELSFVNARSILHVADLERIISAIRSQNLSGGKQITIELNRSVFDGLKIVLTMNSDKKISTEFLATNENVKSQLHARAEEIAGIFKDRGVKIEELKMTLSSDTNDQQNSRDEMNSAVENTNFPQTKTASATHNEDEVLNDSDTSYQI